MSKKILSILMSVLVVTSVMGCSNKGQDKAQDTKTSSVEKSADDVTDEEDKSLEGEWAKDYTLDEAKKLFEDKLIVMKDITENVGIKAEEEEKIKNEDDVFTNDKCIFFDNADAQDNKIENMYFGFRTYGENIGSGVISFKAVLKFNESNAVSNNDFDLGNTTIAKYIAGFTGKTDRDYSSINKEILDKLKANEKEVKITNTIDGLKEEIVVSNEAIFYKLSTKKYKFNVSDLKTDNSTNAATQSSTETNTGTTGGDSTGN